MENRDNGKELACIAGAYGPLERIPLLGELIGPKLMEMTVIGYCSELGSVSGILQNDGTLFPVKARTRLFKTYCQKIRSTVKGQIRCRACDCQAVIKLTGGNHIQAENDLEEAMKNFPIERIDEFNLLEERVYCYKCRGGLLEFVRPISLDFRDGSPTPVGAIWAGQNKVKDYCLSENEVRELASEIDYSNSEELVALYKDITFINKAELSNRAKSLVETARPIEDSASAVSHNKRQSQYDQLIVTLLNNLRTSLSEVKAISAKNTQEQVYTSMLPGLKEITNNVGNCYAALCEIPESVDDTRDSKVQIRVVAHAGICKRKLEKTYTINLRQTDLNKIFHEIEGEDRLKTFSSCDLDLEFFEKFKNAIQIHNISHAIVGRIPTLQNRIVWVTLLCDNCDALTPRGNLMPAFIKMLDNISQNASQIVSMAYLLARQRDAVQTLRKQKQQLEQKDSQNKELFQNISHQVSRPLVELKQSAYILSLGFSKDAYEGFRACLTEYERGCRNFALFEQIIMGLGEKEYTSLDIEEIVNKAYERVEPYLRAERRELFISKNIDKGHSIPNLIGNPEAILECLVNVFHNAIKYSLGSRPIEVEIAYSLGSSEVKIRVINYGIEITEEDKERIFERAVRGETTKAVPVEGSGIGLYISRKLIELQSSSIKIESCIPAAPRDNGKPRWRTTLLISLKCL